jgi:6-phosphogluconolactonase (cycloisomerase 2 family)
LRRALAPALFALLAACGQTTPEGPGEMPPMTESGALRCTPSAPSAPAPGSTLAFQVVRGAVITYGIDAATGCWTRLDEDPALPSSGPAALDGSGRFLYVSGDVAEDVAGVHAFRVDRARGALERIGAFPVEEAAFLSPGWVAATDDAVYMVSHPIGTGYHGRFWRYDIDRSSGRLLWRGEAFRSKETWFLELSRNGSAVWIGGEVLGRLPGVRALRIGSGGTLDLVDESDAMDHSRGEADPQGRFLWVATDSLSGGRDFEQVLAFRPAPNGALGTPGRFPWRRGGPAAHPSGQILYGLTLTHLDSFAIDPATGAPSVLATVPHGLAEPWLHDLAVDPSGQRVYVIASNEVRAFRTDALGRLQAMGRVADTGGRLVLTQVP